MDHYECPMVPPECMSLKHVINIEDHVLWLELDVIIKE